MARYYATFTKGDSDVRVWDTSHVPVKGKSFSVFRNTGKKRDPNTGKEVLDLGPTQIKVDAKVHDCIQFLIFDTQQQLNEWLAKPSEIKS